MYALTVAAHVLENKTETFLKKLATRKENGNVRYDILQNEEDPLCFLIYEVYLSKDDFLLHHETPHSKIGKAETESMLAKPREMIRCHSIYFSD